jgi:bacteriorhodopsin
MKKSRRKKQLQLRMRIEKSLRMKMMRMMRRMMMIQVQVASSCRKLPWRRWRYTQISVEAMMMLGLVMLGDHRARAHAACLKIRRGGRRRKRP